MRLPFTFYNATMPERSTALFYASQDGDYDVAKALIDAGANPDHACSDDGQTPLFTAAHQQHPKLVTLLLDADANLDQPMRDGTSPLHAAAAVGDIEIALMLLSRGCRLQDSMDADADAEAEDEDEDEGGGGGGAFPRFQLSPMMLAVGLDRFRMVHVLASYGSSLKTRDLSNPRVQVSQAIVRWIASDDVRNASQLRIAITYLGAGMGYVSHVKRMLQGGRLRPETLPATELMAVRKAAATAFNRFEAHASGFAGIDCSPMEPGALQASCRKAVQLAGAATFGGWSPASHWLHQPRIRRAVHCLMLVSERLFRTARALQGGECPAGEVDGDMPTPELPPELWSVIASFVSRKDYAYD